MSSRDPSTLRVPGSDLTTATNQAADLTSWRTLLAVGRTAFGDGVLGVSGADGEFVFFQKMGDATAYSLRATAHELETFFP